MKGRAVPNALRGDPFVPLPGNVRGALWLLLSALAFSGMNGLIKGLGSDVHPFQIAFFRSLFGLAVVLPFVVRTGWRGMATARPGIHGARAFFGVSAMLCSFYALAHLPLATAVAIMFAKPLFMIVLAVLFLGETVRWRRWSATAVGMAGVLVMLRPGGGEMFAALMALAAALFAAMAFATVKRMTATERPMVVLFWFSVLATVGTLPPALFVWRLPSGTAFALLLAVGALGSLAQYFLVRAFTVGEATAVVPVDYLTLLFSGLIGYLFFAEVPDRTTVIGGAIVVASTLYIVGREARLGAGERQRPPN